MGKKLTLQDVEVHHKMRPEAMPVEFEEDEQFEQYVSDQLAKGNQWAWCMVEVRMSWHSHEVTDLMLQCSYKSEEDFLKGDSYRSVLQICLDQLNWDLKQLKNVTRGRGIISTEFLPATDTEGKRIKAVGKLVNDFYDKTLPYDYSVDRETNHDRAAQAIMDEWIWLGESIKFVSIENPDGQGYTYVGERNKE